MVVGFWGGGNEIEREARVCKKNMNRRREREGIQISTRKLIIQHPLLEKGYSTSVKTDFLR